MSAAIKYRKSTGQPFGVIEATDNELLALQYSELNVDTGVIEIAGDHAFFQTRDFTLWTVQDGQFILA